MGTQSTGTRTLVWIDAREAVVVSWLEDRAQVEKLESDVPDHRKSTGHVRHDSTFRHGGGGAPQTAGEPRREEHLNRFVEHVAERLPLDVDLLILGPGTTRERLERHVRELDAHRLHPRTVTCEASAPRTDRQLIARLRHVAGADPQRREAREQRDETIHGVVG
ncbi:MAG TPA: hypothetical protein VFC81_02785 [Verrucomicrobiae bacterium]|nr:hypothetical protein [Verrucomicrobiae bacterium]